MKKQLTAAALAVATLLSPLGAQAQTAAEADSWKFSLMPYLWLPTIKTNLNFGPVAASRLESEISVAPDEWLRDLKMAALLAGEARYGNWLLGGDLVYMHLGDTTSKTKVKNIGPGPVQTVLNADADSSLKTVIWSMVGGYSVVAGPAATVDLIAGFRYLWLEGSTDWNLIAGVTGPNGNSIILPRAGGVSKSQSVTTGIVGAKGRVKLGESNWFVPFYVDVGGGNSVTTWQAAAGIGYAYPWGDVRLDYRYMSFDQNGDKLIKDLDMGGVALGVNFVF
jgi:opacity protein-like surface antigen